MTHTQNKFNPNSGSPSEVIKYCLACWWALAQFRKLPGLTQFSIKYLKKEAEKMTTVDEGFFLN